MTKFPPIPRLSIVVPVGRDLAKFENSLISVLENQPDGSEILVCHDGRYDDPFDLASEVRLVTGVSGRLVDLVAAGATAAHGRFVHVLADGLRAVDGWADGAIEKFEHFDAGVVAPVIRSGPHRDILAAGWYDGIDRLCKPVAAGKTEVPRSAAKLIGAYLSASFWRRDLLQSMHHACDLTDDREATYAYELLSRSAGWRCVLAENSEVIADDDEVPGDDAAVGRGRRLRAIRGCFGSSGWSAACKVSSLAVLANALRPSMIGEAIGQALAPLSHGSIVKSLHRSEVAVCADCPVIRKMPTQASHRQAA